MDGHYMTSSAALARMLARLQKVRRSGRDRWTACCPAHDDARPSLSLKLQPDGRILLHCFAGCSAHEVVSAAGMDLAELFPQQELGLHRRPKVDRPFSLHDVVRCLAVDALLIVQCANVLLRGEALTEAGHSSLKAAAARFLAAEGLLDA